jgi:hypothetical protein
MNTDVDIKKQRRRARMLVKKNTVYVGNIKDTDGIWHPVITSPDEDFVQTYCATVTERENGGFFSDIYTVEMIPFILTDEFLEDGYSSTEWDASFEEIEDEELFSAVDGSPAE